MENEAFDRALRDFVGESRLPFDDAVWKRLDARLDAAVLPPAAVPRRKKVLPLLLKVSAAAAVLLLAAGLSWQYLRSSAPADGVQPLAAAQPGLPSPAPQPRPAVSTAPASLPPRTAPATHRQAPAVTQQPDAAVLIGAALPEPTVQTLAGTAPPQPQLQSSPLLPPRSAAAGPELEGLAPGEPPRLAATTVGIHGGYNLGAAKSNFTLGLNLRRSIGRRFQVDAGLAIVSGSYGSYRTAGIPVSDPLNPGITGNNDTIPVRQEVASTLFYLQAAPSLSYRIYKGWSAGAGIDAQRLLSSTSKAQIRGLDGEPERPLPEWDFGLTARMDFQLSKRLRTGLMYRESIRATFSGAAATNRNYLLVLLGYTLF